MIRSLCHGTQDLFERFWFRTSFKHFVLFNYFVLTRDTFLRSSHKVSRVVHIANKSLFSVELEKLLFNEESTALSNKICLQSIISIVTSNKNELRETVVLTRFQKRQLQSVLILFRFLHPFLNLLRDLYFLSSYCYFSLNLVTIPSVWILINFVTLPLIRGMFPFFSLANLDQK